MIVSFFVIRTLENVCETAIKTAVKPTENLKDQTCFAFCFLKNKFNI